MNKFTYDDKHRIVLDDGRKLPSVTKIVSEATAKGDYLLQWAANCVIDYLQEQDTITNDVLNSARFNWRDVSKTALDVGSEVHRYIEVWLSGDKPKPPSSEQAWNAINAAKNWFKDHNYETYQTEMRVIGSDWGGTLDWYGMLHGRTTVIDFKSSKAIYWDSYGPQVAAYRSVVGAESSGILRLDKTSGLPEYRSADKRHEKDLSVFRLMVELFYARHPLWCKWAGRAL